MDWVHLLATTLIGMKVLWKIIRWVMAYDFRQQNQPASCYGKNATWLVFNEDTIVLLILVWYTIVQRAGVCFLLLKSIVIASMVYHWYCYHIKSWQFVRWQTLWCYHIDGFVQNCSNTIANALELLRSFTKPSINTNILFFVDSQRNLWAPANSTEDGYEMVAPIPREVAAKHETIGGGAVVLSGTSDHIYEN